MLNEQEIKALKEELDKLTGFIGENGSVEQVTDKNQLFACNVTDSLAWVLEETQTLVFTSSNYIDLDHLNRIASEIEKRTGKKLSDYQ